MIGYFASIPKELDEAALIDGAGWMQMLFKIFIPVAMPGIIAATIFAFTVSWAPSSIRWPSSTAPDQMVLTVGVVQRPGPRRRVRSGARSWPARCWRRLPPVIIYAFLMDYYIAGLTAGATKG